MRPQRRQPTRLPCPWDSPGKNTGVGCHFLLQCMKVKSEREVAQSCPTLSDPMDCSLPGSSVHGMFQARVLEWGATAFSCVLVLKKPGAPSSTVTSLLPACPPVPQTVHQRAGENWRFRSIKAWRVKTGQYKYTEAGEHCDRNACSPLSTRHPPPVQPPCFIKKCFSKMKKKERKKREETNILLLGLSPFPLFSLRTEKEKGQ